MMNEQLQLALTELLTKTMSGVDQASEFLVAETPEVINQLLLWYGVHSLVTSVLALIVLIITIVLTVKFSGRGSKIDPDDSSYNNHHWTLTHDNDGGFSPHSVISGVVLICVIPVIFMSINLEWLQIWIAPKIWLIEYTANLTK